MSDKSAIAELVWLYRAHQQALPFVQRLYGWLSDPRHRGRQRGDYCPFPCYICGEQRIIDESPDWLAPAITPGL